MELDQEIAVIKEGYADIVQQAEAKQVSSQIQADETNLILKRITNAINNIEDKRLSFTTPLNQSLKTINATFKELTIPLTNAKDILVRKVMQWRSVEQEKIRLEQERIAKIEREEARRRAIQEAHKEAGHQVKEPIVLEKPLPPAELKVSDTTKTRKIWTWELQDASKVPGEYKTINETKITQAVRIGIREIKGVRIWEKEIYIS